MSTSVSSTDQVLEAMRWYFGKQECRTIQFSDDTSGDQAGDSFDLNVIDEDYAEKKYLVWLDDGIAAAPTPAADQTLVGVSYSQDDDAATIAAAVIAQLDTDGVEVRTTDLLSGLVRLQNQFVGLITAEVSTNAPDIVKASEVVGFGGYLGQTTEAELSIEESTVELLDDAQGTTVLDEILVGTKATISFSLKEMTTARWESLVGNVGGDTVTIDSSDITGYGTSKLYNSKFSYAGRLIAHPVRLANSNRDSDIIMLSTSPKMSSINFSGASAQEAAFEFVSYKDSNAPVGINLLARGDHSKF